MGYMDKAIIAKCKGCCQIVAAVLDIDSPEAGHDVIQWLRDDLQLEYVDFPVRLHRCTCVNKQRDI